MHWSRYYARCCIIICCSFEDNFSPLKSIKRACTNVWKTAKHPSVYRTTKDPSDGTRNVNSPIVRKGSEIVGNAFSGSKHSCACTNTSNNTSINGAHKLCFVKVNTSWKARNRVAARARAREFQKSNPTQTQARAKEIYSAISIHFCTGYHPVSDTSHSTARGGGNERSIPQSHRSAIQRDSIGRKLIARRKQSGPTFPFTSALRRWRSVRWSNGEFPDQRKKRETNQGRLRVEDAIRWCRIQKSIFPSWKHKLKINIQTTSFFSFLEFLLQGDSLDDYSRSNNLLDCPSSFENCFENVQLKEI